MEALSSLQRSLQILIILPKTAFLCDAEAGKASTTKYVVDVPGNPGSPIFYPVKNDTSSFSVSSSPSSCSSVHPDGLLYLCVSLQPVLFCIEVP